MRGGEVASYWKHKEISTTKHLRQDLAFIADVKTIKHIWTICLKYKVLKQIKQTIICWHNITSSIYLIRLMIESRMCPDFLTRANGICRETLLTPTKLNIRLTHCALHCSNVAVEI